MGCKTLSEQGWKSYSRRKKHVSNYKKAISLRKNIQTKANELIKSDSRLKRDFGDGTDDEEFLEYVASGYGISTKALRESMVKYSDFYRNNSESIKLGQKITSRVLKNNAKYVPSYSVDYTGSMSEYYRR